MSYYQPESFCPDQSIGYLVRRIHQLGQLLLEPIHAAEGLTGIHWSTLVTIHVGRGATAGALAREIGYDKGAMTRVVDQLAERGLVARERDADDRRIVNLSLTEEGRTLARRSMERVLERWNEWLTGWDEQEIDLLIDRLSRLKAGLEARVATEEAA